MLYWKHGCTVAFQLPYFFWRERVVRDRMEGQPLARVDGSRIFV
jgi:hypothetical protein